MTLTIHNEVEQRSDEWYALRCGVLTASAVGKLISIQRASGIEYSCDDCGAAATFPCVSKAKTKGEPAPIKTIHPARTRLVEVDNRKVFEVADDETSRALIATLVAERLAGWAEETPMTSDMWRGVEVEPIARDAYGEHWTPANEVGFMVRQEDDWTLGYSPDGLVDEDGLIECKAPRAKGQILAVLADEVPSYWMGQIQAGLLVSGRQWLDFIPYVGGLPLWVKRVYPDPQWQAVIIAACRRFERVAAEMVSEYRARTAGLPATERFDPMKVELKLA